MKFSSLSTIKNRLRKLFTILDLKFSKSRKYYLIWIICIFLLSAIFWILISGNANVQAYIDLNLNGIEYVGLDDLENFGRGWIIDSLQLLNCELSANISGFQYHEDSNRSETLFKIIPQDSINSIISLKAANQESFYFNGLNLPKSSILKIELYRNVLDIKFKISHDGELMSSIKSVLNFSNWVALKIQNCEIQNLGLNYQDSEDLTIFPKGRFSETGSIVINPKDVFQIRFYLDYASIEDKVDIVQGLNAKNLRFHELSEFKLNYREESLILDGEIQLACYEMFKESNFLISQKYIKAKDFLVLSENVAYYISELHIEISDFLPENLAIQVIGENIQTINLGKRFDLVQNIAPSYLKYLSKEPTLNFLWIVIALFVVPILIEIIRIFVSNTLQKND